MQTLISHSIFKFELSSGGLLLNWNSIDISMHLSAQDREVVSAPMLLQFVKRLLFQMLVFLVEAAH